MRPTSPDCTSRRSDTGFQNALAPRLDFDSLPAKETPLFYWIMKTFLFRPILLSIFRPWVIGKENVP